MHKILYTCLLRHPAIAILLFAISALLLASCGAPLPPERTLVVSATEMRYTPDRITAKVGEKVFIRMNNDGQEAHNLVLELPWGERTISATPGISAVLAFSAQEAGTYRFYCSIPGHEAQVGTLVIEP